jgi:L,D-transpeptidase ErfK/SrfK
MTGGVKQLSYVILTSLSLTCLTDLAQAKSYGAQLCQYNDFTCITVKRGQSWQSLWPNPRERDIVMRINRLNIMLYPGMVIAVPQNLDRADIMDYSPFPSQVEAIGEKFVVVDPIQLAWGAYDSDGSLVRWGPASSGSDFCKDIGEACQTNAGEFRVFSLGSSSCISHKFPLPDGGAPMPYCMYFNNGQALHGEPYGLPGYNASHGCVRMYVNDAEWLRYDFVEPPNPSNQYRGTKIVVGAYTDSGEQTVNMDDED